MLDSSSSVGYVSVGYHPLNVICYLKTEKSTISNKKEILGGHSKVKPNTWRQVQITRGVYKDGFISIFKWNF